MTTWERAAAWGRRASLRTWDRAAFSLGLALLLAAVLSGCADLPPFDEIGAPIIVQGDVVDDAGRPVKGAEVTLTVHDFEDAVVVAPVIWATSTTTDDQGRYVFRGVPAPEIVAFVEGDAFVNMDLLAVHVDRQLVGSWAFTRELDGASWAGEVPTFQIPLRR